jgi:hypothetical protein
MPENPFVFRPSSIKGIFSTTTLTSENDPYTLYLGTFTTIIFAP